MPRDEKIAFYILLCCVVFLGCVLTCQIEHLKHGRRAVSHHGHVHDGR